jgi:hypothetical protein
MDATTASARRRGRRRVGRPRASERDRLEHDVEGPEEWRFALTVLDLRPDDEALPRVLELGGED